MKLCTCSVNKPFLTRKLVFRASELYIRKTFFELRLFSPSHGFQNIEFWHVQALIFQKNTYLLQLCYSLFESPQYSGFDVQINILTLYAL